MDFKVNDVIQAVHSAQSITGDSIEQGQLYQVVAQDRVGHVDAWLILNTDKFGGGGWHPSSFKFIAAPEVATAPTLETWVIKAWHVDETEHDVLLATGWCGAVTRGNHGRLLVGTTSFDDNDDVCVRPKQSQTLKGHFEREFPRTDSIAVRSMAAVNKFWDENKSGTLLDRVTHIVHDSVRITTMYQARARAKLILDWVRLAQTGPDEDD